MHLRSLNLALIRQASKGDEWEGSCLAQSAHKYVKEYKSVSLEPANKYIEEPLKE
jgi:hypothetical protein